MKLSPIFHPPSGRICAVPLVKRTRFNSVVKASGDSSGDGDNLNDMFKKELKRRQINSIDDIPDKPESKVVSRSVTPPPPFANQPRDDDVPPQLQKSRELNSEGLEGLIPRASVLIRLGGSFFLGFAPFILAVVLAFGAIYAVFGDNFVHSGRPAIEGGYQPPKYDPLELLNEATVDPMIPM